MGEALEALSRKTQLRPKSIEALHFPSQVPAAGGDLDEWMQMASTFLKIDTQSIETPYPEVESFLRGCGPAIIRLDSEQGPLFLAIVRSRCGFLGVLAPDLTLRWIRAQTIGELLRRPVEAPFLQEISRALDNAQVGIRRRTSIAKAMAAHRLRAAQIEGCWILRSGSFSPIATQIRESRLVRRLAFFLSSYTIDYLLALGSWWVIGRAALQGRLNFGLLVGWACMLFTRVPLGMLTNWTQGLVAVHAGALLKNRLLAGCLRLSPEEVRRQGVGQLLGRVIESEALESLALGGGLTGLAAVIEIIVVCVVLIWGASNLLLALMLLACIAVMVLVARGYFNRRDSWTAERIEITNALVERMIGHRTRLAQEPRTQWHVSEDAALDSYLEVCARLDRSGLRLVAIVPRGWIILGLLCLAPAIISGTAAPTMLAVAFGGILLGQSAIQKLTQSLAYLTGAMIAWKQVKPLFHATAHEEETGSVSALALTADATFSADSNQAPPVLAMYDVAFRHEGRAENALDNCNLMVRAGEQLLLEGASGSGKSTLVSLAGGLRQPHSGLILLRGLDRKTLGSRAWRRLVACVPQFGENHIFSASLAFNLLMGRRWPATPQDCVEAEQVCRELGLGELLDRMPGGLQQPVGETGWQLSYGERSRVFIARALLQGADLTILDENLGALDPERLPQVAGCIRRRASTLLVTAHP